MSLLCLLKIIIPDSKAKNITNKTNEPKNEITERKII